MSGAEKLKLHSGELYVEFMQSADWSKPGEDVARAPRTIVKRKQISAKEQRSAKHRETFLEKQSVREQEFKMKFEVLKKEMERRAKEISNSKERDFEERFQQFRERNQTLVREVDGAIRADEAWRKRKKERLYNEWISKVFQPMQDQLSERINSMSDSEIEEKRRFMFECFLQESNKKANGLFRDIIIESDYDPLAQAESATVTYARASNKDDPTKNRGTRELADPLVRGLLQESMEDDRRGKYKRDFVPVEMWDRMEATPHGRYNKKQEKKPDFNRSHVSMNHYCVPSGAEGLALVRQENSVKGKRVISGPVSGSQINECFIYPTKQSCTLPALENPNSNQ